MLMSLYGADTVVSHKSRKTLMALIILGEKPCLQPISELKSYSLITVTLPENYGYCIFVAIGSMFVIDWKSMKLEQARKTYNIPYPIMYSEKHEEFNTIQRAHHSLMERYPQFLGLLLLGGLDSPAMSAAGGAMFILARISTTLGCCKGDAEKLVSGALGYVGWFAMVASTTKLALRLFQIGEDSNILPGMIQWITSTGLQSKC